MFIKCPKCKQMFVWNNDTPQLTVLGEWDKQSVMFPGCELVDSEDCYLFKSPENIMIAIADSDIVDVMDFTEATYGILIKPDLDGIGLYQGADNIFICPIKNIMTLLSILYIMERNRIRQRDPEAIKDSVRVAIRNVDNSMKKTLEDVDAAITKLQATRADVLATMRATTKVEVV